PEELALLDLGEHRLKDLSTPEHVYQLLHDGLPVEFPPLQSVDRARNNLATQTSSFVGREIEQTELLAQVRTHRLVTVTGFGGMGKTRLALQVAAELAADDFGEVWFVDLSGTDDASAVPARVAATLGVPSGAEEPTHALVRVLQDRPTLLVLDNVEQVLDG